MSALISKKTIIFPMPSDNDRRAHDQRLQEALGLGLVEIPLSVMKRLPALVLRNTPFPGIIGRIGHRHRLIDIDAERSFSIALDLGTTNLVALLYDNVAKKDVCTRSVENPQIAFGSDILTRMHHAMSEQCRRSVPVPH